MCDVCLMFADLHLQNLHFWIFSKNSVRNDLHTPFSPYFDTQHLICKNSHFVGRGLQRVPEFFFISKICKKKDLYWVSQKCCKKSSFLNIFQKICLYPFTALLGHPVQKYFVMFRFNKKKSFYKLKFVQKMVAYVRIEYSTYQFSEESKGGWTPPPSYLWYYS